MLRQTRMTLFGLPVVISDDMPPGKIALHASTLRRIHLTRRSIEHRVEKLAVLSNVALPRRKARRN